MLIRNIKTKLSKSSSKIWSCPTKKMKRVQKQPQQSSSKVKAKDAEAKGAKLTNAAQRKCRETKILLRSNMVSLRNKKTKKWNRKKKRNRKRRRSRCQTVLCGLSLYDASALRRHLRVYEQSNELNAIGIGCSYP
ncbi:hypothetical protein V1517DRAFT_306861 [Lipomyces orientalis]|uniref:Uncharacterized protein n=1 Tax=Lipomyces orientalis TaxID=1233043 RepID=A0ACC3TS32_9ASCO